MGLALESSPWLAERDEVTQAGSFAPPSRCVFPPLTLTSCYGWLEDGPGAAWVASGRRGPWCRHLSDAHTANPYGLRRQGHSLAHVAGFTPENMGFGGGGGAEPHRPLLEAPWPWLQEKTRQVWPLPGQAGGGRGRKVWVGGPKSPAQMAPGALGSTPHPPFPDCGLSDHRDGLAAPPPPRSWQSWSLLGHRILPAHHPQWLY